MLIDNSKKTAHQLWCDAFTTRLAAILYPPSMEHHKLAFMTTRTTVMDRCKEACTMAVHVENTRLRVLTDEMIALLEATSVRIKEINQEQQVTPWILQGKRRRLRRQHAEQLILQTAYQNAVLVLVNTPPPAAEEIDKNAPREEAVPPPTPLRYACEPCRGTGYARVSATDETLCEHCHGSGVQPEKGGQNE